MNLTTLILVKNNASTIEKCLSSIKSSESILIGDLGCSDESLDICLKYTKNVRKLSLNDDFATAKNSLLSYVKTNWILSLNPWEYLLSGENELNLIKQSSDIVSFNVKVAQGGVITQDIRLWNKTKNLKFKNPIFEYVDDIGIDAKEIIIYSNNSNIDFVKKRQIIEKWMINEPLSKVPYYYKAIIHLMSNQFKEFQETAGYYLFNNKEDDTSSLILLYYLAYVQLYVLEDTRRSMKNVIKCLALKINTPEFWCLLGDIYYKLEHYGKAKSFYRNAILFGEKHVMDKFPCELAKYKQYPLKMIESCINSNFH